MDDIVKKALVAYLRLAKAHKYGGTLPHVRLAEAALKDYHERRTRQLTLDGFLKPKES